MHANPTTGPDLEFGEVYREHHAFVWQTLRCLGVVDSALDDAVQDVFVVVYRRLAEFEGRAAIKTWLFEIVRRVASRYRTRAHRDAARTFELPELRGEDDLDAAVDRALAVELLRAFADTLDEDRLRVFVLSEFGQMRGREIAEELGVNLNTVYRPTALGPASARSAGDAPARQGIRRGGGLDAGGLARRARLGAGPGRCSR